MVEDLDELNRYEIHRMLVQSKIIIDRTNENQDWIIPNTIECKNSFYIFNRNGILRRTCYFVQNHRYFDRFIMFLIAVSSLQLAFETYLQGYEKDDPILESNENFGRVFTYFFLLEFLFKLIALGFIMENGSYLRESWN